MSDHYKSESILKFGASFFYKILLEGIYDDFFAGLERDLTNYDETLHKLDVQSLLNLIATLENVKSCLPLPIYLKEQIIESRMPGDEDILTVKSYENDRRRILETTEIIEQKVIRRLIDIEPDIQEELLSQFKARIQASDTSDNTPDKSSITSSVQSARKVSKIFSQMVNQDCLDFLIATYKGCKSRDIVPMLYAVTDLGLINKAKVFNNQTKLYEELQEHFDFEDKRQSLNRSIIAHNRPNSKQRDAIKHQKSKLLSFLNKL
ncbi:hypothetical protein [Spirosoma arcticum]